MHIFGNRLCYQLRIRLKDVRPECSRSLLVPQHIPLHLLHRAIQISFGWHDEHTRAFVVGRTTYTNGDRVKDSDRPESDRALNGVVGNNSRFKYIYDFGDNWEHIIEVEQLLDADDSMNQPIACLAAKGPCPPENIGGPEGYRAQRHQFRDLAPSLLRMFDHVRQPKLKSIQRTLGTLGRWSDSSARAA